MLPYGQGFSACILHSDKALLLFAKLILAPYCYSHIGFLPNYVKHLKDMKFLREDLIFSVHSEEVFLTINYFVLLLGESFHIG